MVPEPTRLGMARAALSRRVRAVLATRDDALGVHAVLVNAFVIADEPFEVGVLARATSRKVANLRRDGRCALSLVEGATYVTLVGLATVDERPGAVALAEQAFEEAFGRPPRPAPAGSRVAVTVRVQRVLADGSRRPPPEAR